MAGNGYLHKYFLNNSSKRLHKWFHYFDIYERHFERFRGKSPTMIEIGIFGGGSLEMWKSYFGEGAKIIGVDINPECKKHETQGIEVFIGSQDDKKLLTSIFDKYGEIDVILDDGSHMMQHMIATFEICYGRLKSNGGYMVEDTHTCYWPEYGGGVKNEGSFMEFVKGRMDDMNAIHTRGVLEVSDFTKSTDCICCYDSVVVFEKRGQGKRQAQITESM